MSENFKQSTEVPATMPLKFSVTYERWILEKGIKIGVTKEFLRSELDVDQALGILQKDVEAAIAEAVPKPSIQQQPQKPVALIGGNIVEKPAPPQPEVIDFEGIGWRKFKSPKEACDIGEAGWAYAEANNEYDSAEQIKLKKDMETRLKQKSPIAISMGGVLFSVRASQGKDERWYLNRTRIER